MNAPRHDGAAALPRPHLRRPPPRQVATYRLRVDLDGAVPPVWRIFEVRSDLTLDVVHVLLQAAYGWSDSHLHRFAIGGRPLDFDSELFLCAYDVEQSDDEGTPEADVRLDETVQEVGDELHYVYDYGDQWELTVTLEELFTRGAGALDAVCLDGARLAPPEDSGGVGAADPHAQEIPHPRGFHADVVNQAIARALDRP